MKWHKKSSVVPKTIESLLKIVFKNRNIQKEDTEEFLHPKNPLDFSVSQLKISKTEFSEALKLIKKFLKEDKRIVIFGDYDVDGICASAILWQVLFKLYKTHHPEGKKHPVPFIPHREKHGYGITQVAIDEIVTSYDPDLIITVDNGIVAHEAVQYARDKGIAVIITDHHQPEKKGETEIFPPATHIVHTTQLCGATVSWMLAKGLDAEYAEQLLDLAGIATIADQVPLLKANRSFATFGIKALRKSKNLGILELCKVSQVKQTEITEGTIGFVIAPRINAMGRLEHGLDALRLLCTKNKKQAEELASILQATNVTRQDLTKEMLDDAMLQVSEIITENLIIVHSEKYHEGILGLIAGGLSEKYYKPSIAISLGADLAKASARSIQEVNITEILREIRDDLVSVGGHPMAAGFSFLPEKLETIKKRLFQLANEKIKKSQLERGIEVECEIPVQLISVATIESLSEFAPYGMANVQPVFEIKNLKVLEIKKIGKEQEHIKLKVQEFDNSEATAFDCLGWRMSDFYSDLKVNSKISLIGTLDINEWREKKYPQVILKDIQTT